jgi:hypothetical protein
MKKILLAICFIAAGNFVFSQTAEDSVKATINKLFEGMKSADGTVISSCFADSAVLQTIVNTRDGRLTIRNEKVSNFAEQVGKSPKGALDERIEFGSIKIDGPLASVWTPYKFYYNGQFSHCGANSFQLVRFNGQWKIQYLIDTRRRQGCD